MIYKNKTKHLKLTTFLLLLITSGIGLNSCYSDYGLATTDFDIVATFYDDRTDFSSYKTYAMPDSVFHIVGENERDNISREFDSYILSKVADNMESGGYTRILDPEASGDNKPDLVLYVSVTTSTHSGAIYYPPYWGYPGWGWYYPPYWGSTAYYSYSTGTILLHLGDTDQLDSDNQIIEPQWSANINGLLENSAASTKSRIGSSIDQAYVQSPYLKTN